MALDPITATGLVGNIVQLIQFSSDIIFKSREIYSSAAGAARETIHLKASAENFIAACNQLRTSLRPGGTLSVLAEEEQQLEDVVAQSMAVGAEILEDLDKLEVKGGLRKWKSFRKALKTLRWKDKIEAMERRLVALGNMLAVRTAIDTRYTNPTSKNSIHI